MMKRWSVIRFNWVRYHLSVKKLSPLKSSKRHKIF